MKYLGAATDCGEYWEDWNSEAKDLGPGVSFTVRCAEDGGKGPHLICCYGLQNDVNLEAVAREAERIITAYKAHDTVRFPNGRPIQGPLRPPRPEYWPTLEEVLVLFRESVPRHKATNQRMGRMVWSIRDVVWDVTGSGAMTDRVIERVGMAELERIYEEV